MNSINSNRAPEMGKSNVSLKASLMPWLISGYAIIGTVFLLLGGWAATAPIAKAVVAVGAVKVDTSRKRVQHQDGGTISEILVRDGDRVIAGQVLVRLDDTRSSASLGIVRSTYDAELARVARLESERDGRSEIQFPKELTDRKGDSKIDELLELQVELFNARRDSLKGSIEILTSQIAQLQERQRGIRSIVSAIDAQVKLVDDEMPFGHRRVGLDRALNMMGIVLFSAGGSDRGQAHLTGGHIKIDDEGQGAVSNVLELASLHLAGSQW